MKVGILGLLGVAFVVLKLIGQIDWSWWWVLAPFWVGVASAGIVFLVGLIATVIVHCYILITLSRK